MRGAFACAVVGAVAAIVALPSVAHAQACCAGAAAVTPGRLALHEDALVGVDARVTDGYGSFDPTGTFVSMPAGTSEVDLEQDVFGAIRFAPRAQAAVLVPIIETRRTVPGENAFGGGLGDINVAARYDFIYSSEARYVPGIAVLAGVTFPTGTPPESATAPLATNATGIGAYQGNLGVAVEKVIGPWLVGATGILAVRSTRTYSDVTTTLAPQWTALAVVARTLSREASVAVSVSVTAEGDATVNDMNQVDTSRRLLAFSLSGAMPVTDRLHLQGAVVIDPPMSAFGANQPVAGVGVTATVIYAWL